MNIQTIPRDDKVVKAAFIPKLDAFLYCDYPNIELKLLAYYMEQIGHPSMAEVFRNGADLHIETAAGLFGKPSSEVTDADRQVGKRLNFSIVYGGGIPTIMEQLKIEKVQALDLLRKYHATWPGIGWAGKNRKADPGTLSWWIEKRLQEKGYITTLWGRHLHPHSPHVAINALCQGCSADLMKWALRMIHRWLREHGMRSHLVNVVHDEAQIDAARDELRILIENVPRLMTDERINASVPIVPEPEISFGSWADKEPFRKELL